ncbi:MAG: xanthine dehydrogenase family protein molybdopterin-binding subunit [Burkholderiales bacterium]
MSVAPAYKDVLRPKLIGASVKRVEDPRLLTGRGNYVADLQPRGLLNVAIRRSEHPHARIVRIDTVAAAALPGVIAVVTAADLDALARPIHATSRMPDYYATPLLALARDIVRYVGEPIVAIVAVDRYVAEDALELIDIEFEALPPVTDPQTASGAESPLVHQEAKTNVIVSRVFARGDAKRALADAPVRVKGHFRFHRKTPVAMENRSYVAEFDPARGTLTLHSSTQVPGIIRDALCEILDLPGQRLRVVAPDVGGGFGAKTALYPEEILVCALSRKLGRPIKYVSDRLEDLTATNQAFDETIDAELGLAADGQILALSAVVLGDIGAYSIYPWTAAIEPVQVVSFLPGPYQVPVYLGRVRGVATNKAPMGPYRGVGRPAAVFVMERLIDMAARELGMDPIALRLKNFVQPEQFPYKTAVGLVWDRSGFTECLEVARDTGRYAALREEQTKARAEGRWMGIGVASYAELTGLGSRISAAPGMPINTGTETASLRIDSMGGVTATFGIASHGQGLETTLAQVIADELGARMEDIQIQQGDSALVANGTGTYASRSAVLAGGAATLASRGLRDKIVRVASHLLEAAADDIEVANGRVSVKGTDRWLSFRDVAKAVYSDIARLPKEERIELAESATYDPVFGTTTSASHIAVVDIDPETYQVKIRDFIVVEDCGRVINPLIVDGQVHGGVAQGIGVALFEEVIYDEGAQLLTASLVDYLVPSAPEVPAMTVRHVESNLPNTVNGFRGMGEGGTIGAPAAIANAITDALSQFGIDVNELPASPERLFRAISGAGPFQKEHS